MIHTIQQRMGGRYCSIHVRRGDKLPIVPGLDEATRPANILEKIKTLCPPGSSLYLGTNEGKPGFFDPIKEHYKLYTFKCERGVGDCCGIYIGVPVWGGGGL